MDTVLIFIASNIVWQLWCPSQAFKLCEDWRGCYVHVNVPLITYSISSNWGYDSSHSTKSTYDGTAGGSGEVKDGKFKDDSLINVMKYFLFLLSLNSWWINNNESEIYSDEDQLSSEMI